MKREEYGIITFESTHHAMAAESYLKDQGYFHKDYPYTKGHNSKLWPFHNDHQR